MEKRHEEETGVKRLHEAAVRGNVASLMDLLQEHPLLLDRIIVDHCDSETPLHVAAMLGHIDFARELLNRNKELALELDSKGRSPLHLASAKGYVEIVKMLLEVERSCLCELRDELGRTPLHVAVMKGRDEVLKVLLHANTDMNRILTHHGETILHLAVKHNRLNTLKLLLDHDKVSELLNCKDLDGNTILHIAVTHKQIETIRYLVGGSIVGVEMNVQNKNGLTPLDVSLALQSGSDFRDMEIAKLLGDNEGLRGLKKTTLIKNDENNCESKETDNWVNDVRSGLMVVASLIATIAFQAGLTPAGGLWQDNNGHSAGQSIMGSANIRRYRQYLVFNSISFISSLSIILLLISGFPLRRRLFVWSLMVIMWIACTSMALTYSVSILFEVPNLTSFEDNLTNYSFLGVGVLVGIVLSGNILRLVMWFGRRQGVKQIIMKKLGATKEIIGKKLNEFRYKRRSMTSLDRSPTSSV